MKLIRSLISLAAIIALIYFATVVPLGKKTLWQHMRAIAGSQESQELVQEVKKKAHQVVVTDCGVPAPPPEDNLTPRERKLLRKLIREKIERNKDAEADPRTVSPGK